MAQKPTTAVDTGTLLEPAPPEAATTPMQSRKGPTLVTITASAPVRVVTELVVDGGRERHVNGSMPMEAGQEAHFIVGATQSLRIVEG